VPGRYRALVGQQRGDPLLGRGEAVERLPAIGVGLVKPVSQIGNCFMRIGESALQFGDSRHIDSRVERRVASRGRGRRICTGSADMVRPLQRGQRHHATRRARLAAP